jgi:hypothetical protein
MHPQDTSFLVNGFKPTVAAANPADVAAFQLQRQASAQQLQSGAMDLQQKQTDLRDQQIYSDAMKTAAGDPQKAYMVAAQNGMSGKGLMQYQQNLLKIQETQSVIGKNKAEASKAMTDEQEGQNKMVAGAASSLLALPPSQREGAYPAAMQQIARDMKVDPSTLPQDYASFGASMNLPPDQALLQFRDQHLNNLEQNANVKAGQEKAAADQKLTEDQAEAARKAAIAPSALAASQNTAVTGAPDPVTGLTKEQTQTAANAAATLAQTRARDAQTAKNEGQRNAIAGGELNLKAKTYDQQYGSGASTTAKAIVNGDLDPATVRSMLRKNPGLMAQAKTLDPNFDEATIDSRYATLKEFNNTSVGKAGGQALALNTLVHHAELYQQAGEALRNGSFTPGYAAYNEISKMMGSAAPQNADLVARFLAGETGKVASGGVPAEGEIHGILDNLKTKNSPQQISDAGKTLMQVAAGRFTPLMELVKKNKLDNVVQVLGPDAKEILTRRGFDPNTMKPAGAGGSGALTAAEAKGYLGKTGWTGGAPTQAQKDAAAALAKKDGRTF